MSFDIKVSIEPDFLRITAEGPYSFDDMIRFIDQIKNEAANDGRGRVLVDCRLIVGRMSEADRFQGGEHIARIFGGQVRVALLMPQGQVTKLGELAAVNRGARLRVTENEEEAIEWVLS